MEYFKTSNGKNGRLCKRKGIKSYKVTPQSLHITYGYQIYVDRAYCDGIIKYIGIPPDKSIIYLGIELEHDTGDCDGTYKSNGARYFQCGTDHGVYIPMPSQKQPQSVPASTSKTSTKSKSTTNTIGKVQCGYIPIYSV